MNTEVLFCAFEFEKMLEASHRIESYEKGGLLFDSS